jgi:hypothetical protein
LDERSPSLACDDGSDNDGDKFSDYPDDPGCFGPYQLLEDPACQDGENNDPAEDSLTDFDGGVSAGLPLAQQTDPDTWCAVPWQIQEVRACGLGAELALLLPAVTWLWRRRRSKAFHS